jgi:hypothetical protein
MTDILLPSSATNSYAPFPRSRASQLHEKGAKQLDSALFLDE